jgi:hypothetical protein
LQLLLTVLAVEYGGLIMLRIVRGHRPTSRRHSLTRGMRTRLDAPANPEPLSMNVPATAAANSPTTATTITLPPL